MRKKGEEVSWRLLFNHEPNKEFLYKVCYLIISLKKKKPTDLTLC